METAGHRKLQSAYRFYQQNTIIHRFQKRIESEQIIISRRRLTGYIGEELYLKALNNEYKLDIT